MRHRISPCQRRPIISFRRCRHGAGTFRRHQMVNLGPSKSPSTIQDIEPYGCWSHLTQKCACQNVRVKGLEARPNFQIPVHMGKGYARSLGRGRSEADDGSSSKHLGQYADALRYRPLTALIMDESCSVQARRPPGRNSTHIRGTIMIQRI